MGEMDKTKEQLTQELAQARKRIAELEAKLADSDEPSSVGYYTLRAFFDSATDSFSIWDSSLNMVYLNDATLMKYYPPGTKRSDVIGKHFTELVPGSVESGRYEKYLNVLNTGVPLYIDEFSPHPRFGDMYLAIRAFKIENGLGIITIDNTELKRMEQAIQASQQRLSALIDNAPDVIFTYDIDGRIISGNKKAADLLGYAKGEMLGKTFAESGLLTTDSLAKVSQRLENYKQGKAAEPIPYELIAKNGSHIFVEVRGVPIVQGNTIEIIAIARDITERRRTEEALRQSEEKFRVIFNTIADGISVIDLTTGKLIDTNEAALHMFNFTREDVIGTYGNELIAEKDRARAIEDLKHTIETGDSGLGEWILLGKGGTEHECEARSSVIFGHQGKPLYLVNVMRDISRRKELEEKLRQSEEKIRQIFNSVGVGISVTDMEGKIVEVNDFGLRLCGCSKAEMIGHNGIRFIAERDRPRIIEEMIRTFETGKSSIPEFTALKKDGTEYATETIATVMLDSSGKPTGLITSVTDITQRKRIEMELNDYKTNLERMVQERTTELANAYEGLRQSEERLRNSEEKLSTMFRSMADGVVATDLKGNIKDLNEAQLRLFGYDKKEEVLGQNGFNFISERDHDLAMNDITQLFSEGSVTGKSWTFKHKSGGEFKAELSTTLLKDAKGTPTDMLVVMRDITERKRMEEALRESEAKLRAIYDSIGDGITVTDLKGTILDQNEAGTRLSGYSKKADVTGRNGLSFIAEADRDRAMNDMFNVLQKGIGIATEYKLVNRNGKEFDAEVSGAIIPDSEGKPAAIVNVIRDITERKHIEEALRESEAKYRTLVEQSDQGIAIFKDGCIVFANNALAKINGYSLKEMYAMSPEELLLTVHPEDRGSFVKRITNRFKGDKLMSRHEYRTIRKDGTERNLETYAKIIIYKGQPAIQSTIADITERKQWETKLKESKEELRFYLNQITKAQEEERRKIARELHDDTIQELITLSRQIEDVIDKKIKPDEDKRDSRRKIEAARQKVDTILKGIRRFTQDLRPSVLDDLGLVPALEWLTSDISNRFGIPINISIIGAEQPTTPDAALAMFRIAQESLRNAGQHSTASQIQLNLKYSSKTATLNIIDNGVGFTPPKQTASLTRHGKLGIAGMYERAQLIGATLSIKSKRKQGTTITLEVPIK